MSWMLFRATIWAFLLFSIGVATGSSGERPDSKLVRIEEGTYVIFQKSVQDTAPRELGRESFTKKYFTDNTIVIECAMEMVIRTVVDSFHSVRHWSTLEIEEESLFPRRYEVKKENEGLERFASVEMFANVAVIHRRANAMEERLVRVLSTGAMFGEENLIHQHALLTDRFDSAFLGKQNVTIFDPVAMRESVAAIEYSGETTLVVRGEPKQVKLYKLEMERKPVLELYVDGNGTVLKASNALRESILDAFEKVDFQTPTSR